MFRFGIDVGTGVEQKKFARPSGHECGNTGAIHALKISEFDGRGGNKSPGVSGGYSGINGTFFEKVDGAVEGTVFFTPDRLYCTVGHFNDLGGVEKMETLRGFLPVFGQFRTENVFVSDQNQPLDGGKLFQGLNGGCHRIDRCKIASHCIKSNFHSDPVEGEL
jgi:hypothetical protein